MISRKAGLALCAASLALVLLAVAHLHPGTGFELTFFPSGRLFDTPVVHELFQPDNQQLGAQECRDAYPLLYHEADRAQRWYVGKGGITESMVDAAEQNGGHARLAIIDNRLYVKSFGGGINTRTQAAMAMVYTILVSSPEPLADVEFVIQTSDAGGGDDPLFALDRRDSQPNLWLMPDFGFYSWPEPGVGAYTEVRTKALTFEENLGMVFNGTDVTASSWDRKVPQLFWRGVPMVEVRKDLIRGSEDQPWSDVRSLDWGAVNSEDADRKSQSGDLKTPAEHCAYRFLAHVEGWAYSGRLKYLQQCRSVIVMHPLEWIQHYHHLFNSKDGDLDQNVVEVPLPLEKNLAPAMEKLLDPANQERVERIADNSWRYLRQGYISPSANACYYRYALNAYAEVQRFKPTIGEGVPYESFLLMGKVKWDPHR